MSQTPQLPTENDRNDASATGTPSKARTTLTVFFTSKFPAGPYLKSFFSGILNLNIGGHNIAIVQSGKEKNNQSTEE